MRFTKQFQYLLTCVIFCTMGYGQSSHFITVNVNGKVSSNLPVHWEGSVAYVPVSSLADQLGMRYHENTVKKKVVLTRGQHNIVLTHRNPFLLVDKKAMQMPSPPLVFHDKMHIPLFFFIYASQNLFAERLEFDPNQSVLSVLPGTYTIMGVQIEPKNNGGLIHIKTARQFNLSDISLSINKNWLNVSIFGGSCDSSHIVTENQAGIFKQVVPYIFDQSVQLSFLLNQKVEHKEVYVKPDEITISVRIKNSVPAALNNDLSQDRKRWLIDIIVIDPGHGGRDPGALGSTVKEKQVTLQIARLLRDYLEKQLPNVKIIMTRESDQFIGLKDRTQFANSHHGKLFVSIHANANRSSRCRGFSTYILGQARSEEAINVAQKENSVVELEENPEAYKEFEGPAFILNAIARNRYMKESEDLAGMVNRAMKAKTNIPDQGVHQAGFWVLVGAAMPSILVETAFISNQHEERLLKSRSFQRKVAEAIGESITQFKAVYEKGIG
ncbi:N-acetylmuramoyl-L-alanine amidase [bacterium]|nr:N-acetylmuramoyl-L-alanine amidase [bacterium]RQV98212.1 MAG: hypothetical protein EH221_02245 [bacterium]